VHDRMVCESAADTHF